MILSARFDEAVAYAHQAHADQLRKGTDVPYLSHLLAVAALVLESGGDEVEVIAALLHDAAEDQGGSERLADIRARFGDHVASIVEACSDTMVTPKPPWRERKESYLRHLRGCDEAVLRVSAADKLHNLRCMLSDWKTIGNRLWDRFSAPKRAQLWYYSELVKVYRARGQNSFVVDELELAVELLRQVVEADS